MKLLLELLCSYLLLSETSAFPEVYELYEKRVNTPAPPQKKNQSKEMLGKQTICITTQFSFFISL